MFVVYKPSSKAHNADGLRNRRLSLKKRVEKLKAALRTLRVINPWQRAASRSHIAKSPLEPTSDAAQQRPQPLAGLLTCSSSLNYSLASMFCNLSPMLSFPAHGQVIGQEGFGGRDGCYSGGPH